ncbi:hypothetical protein GALMADRAFT_88953 [Galerina marginata CBS 339.88]|uniref:Nitrogen regulatory protein areA GATA-like domain-containing protein n=1 Tax=Galerina marginata (strain CBS 339.88) TaxID=685588 RepID=A0A067TL88_GALM3|nr:hypothetical protein GALMADRAFT_88953 [Galerina marginata CBS 339.88]
MGSKVKPKLSTIPPITTTCNRRRPHGRRLTRGVFKNAPDKLKDESKEDCGTEEISPDRCTRGLNPSLLLPSEMQHALRQWFPFAFGTLNDTESLTKTWKVASYLEQGQRLENLSWRLWHLQNLMVDTNNARSKREFKKLSKCMGDKLDKEKGRSVEELEAPDFKRNHSIDMIRQRAVEKERNREASQNAQPGTIKRMQFTFSVDQPSQPASATLVKKPDTKPSAEFTKRTRARAQVDREDAVMADTEPEDSTDTAATSSSASSQSLHFPGLFDNDFGPSALLFDTPTLTNRMNYGEGFNPSGNNDQFSISRPTIELPLDDLLFSDDTSNDSASHSNWSSAIAGSIFISDNKDIPYVPYLVSFTWSLAILPAEACRDNRVCKRCYYYY